MKTNMPVDAEITMHIQNLFATYGERKVRKSLNELFQIDISGHQIDKIVLSQDKDRCVVHLVNGLSLHFNFFKMGMAWFEGLDWLETVFNPKPIENKKAA